MTKLKIAFVLSRFPITTETYIINQITDLIDRGHEVDIYAFKEIKNAVVHQKVKDYRLIEKVVFAKPVQVSRFRRTIEFLNFLRVNYKSVDIRRLPRIFNYRKKGNNALNLSYFTRYQWLLTGKDYDIIHAHFGHNGEYIAEMKSLGYLTKSKLVTSFHGYDIRPLLFQKYSIEYKALFAEGDLITVNTPYTLSLLRKITSFKNIVVLPVGLDTGKFQISKRKNRQDFIVLFVGRLFELKAPDRAIEIIRILVMRGYRNVKLKIIGQGGMRKQLEEFVDEHNLNTYVEFAGALSQEEIIEVMEISDVFLFPGRYDKEGRAETQGLVIQEAQAMELPVIVSDVGGMKYGLKDGETGFVVTGKDMASFADKVELLINNEPLKKDMGRKGRQFVVEHYDSRILGNKLESLYYILLEK